MIEPKPATVEWETPPAVFTALEQEFGHFDLDPCATHANHKCPRYYTLERGEDGLTLPWNINAPAITTVFVNPPYGREVGKWVAKALQESARGCVVVVLTASRTDSQWWHNYAMKAHGIYFVRGRIRFVGAKNNSPQFGSAILIYLPTVRKEKWPAVASWELPRTNRENDEKPL